MTEPRPTLGYPSKSAAIVALQEQGWKLREIADRIGMTERQASSLATRYRQRLAARKARHSIELDGPLHADLRREASRLGTSVETLTARLLYHLVRDKLVDAILDGDEP